MRLDKMTEMGYITFVETGSSPSGKTRMWAVMNRTSTDALGSIAWFSPWRKYVFVTSVKEVVFDQECLRQIASFIETETKNHKDAIRSR